MEHFRYLADVALRRCQVMSVPMSLHSRFQASSKPANSTPMVAAALAVFGLAPRPKIRRRAGVVVLPRLQVLW